MTRFRNLSTSTPILLTAALVVCFLSSFQGNGLEAGVLGAMALVCMDAIGRVLLAGRLRPRRVRAGARRTRAP